MQGMQEAGAHSTCLLQASISSVPYRWDILTYRKYPLLTEQYILNPIRHFHRHM